MELTSPAFAHEEAIPARYTCEGNDVSPPLGWSDVPEGTKSLALIVDDPDAPDPKAPRTTWVHWVMYDLPPDLRELAEGTTLPKDAREGLNDWKRTGWGGPCPPIGRHRYFFKLYALDRVLGDLDQPNKAQLVAAIDGFVLTQAVLIGTYAKKKRR